MEGPGQTAQAQRRPAGERTLGSSWFLAGRLWRGKSPSRPEESYVAG